MEASYTHNALCTHNVTLFEYANTDKYEYSYVKKDFI